MSTPSGNVTSPGLSGIGNLSTGIPSGALEAWFPREGHMTLEEAKIYLHAAWRTFNKKLFVLVSIVGFLMSALSFVLEGYVPPLLRWSLPVMFSLAVLFLVVLTAVRANSSLVFAATRILRFAEDQNSTIATLNAEVDALKQKGKTYSDLYVCNAEMYGLALEDTQVSVQVGSNGEMRGRYDLRIKATRPGITAMERFTHGTLEIGPDLEKLGTKEVRHPYKKHLEVVLSPELVTKSSTTATWKLKASPEFPVGISVPYSYSPEFTGKVFSMTTEELYKNELEAEWVSHRITYPSRRVAIQVLLPEGFNPQHVDFDIWYTNMVRIRNHEEYERLRKLEGTWKKEWRDKQLWLQLDVQYPLLALTYAVTWVPPAVWEASDD